MTDENSTPVTPVPGETDTETTPETTVVVQEEAVSTTPVEETMAVEDRVPVYRNQLFVVGMIVLLVLLLTAGLFGLRGCKDDSDTDLGFAGRMIEAPADPAPAVPDGIQSWTEVKEAADRLDADEYEGNIMYDSLGLLHPEQGDIREAVTAMTTLEADGQTFMYVAPLGAKYINTDYSAVEGKLDFYFFEDEVKENEDKFLTFADGTVAVKADCGNAVRFHKDVPSVTKVKGTTPSSPPPPTTQPVTPPTSTKDKGSDTTGGAARQPVNDGNAVQTTTPGYTGGSGSSGPAEAVSTKQTADGDTTANNGQTGYVGTGSGGTTGDGTNSSGETNDGGGATEDSLPGDVETPATGDPGVPD